MVSFVFFLAMVRGDQDDLESALLQVHISVEVLQRLQFVLAGGTPLGREKQADVLESLQVINRCSLSQRGLFPLSFSLATLLDEGRADDFIDAGVEHVDWLHSEIGHLGR